MSTELDALYDHSVLDHSRHPRNRRAIEGGRQAERHNAMCGDRVTVYAQIAAGVLDDVSFEASACAIVVASASLMTEVIRGQAVPNALALGDRLRGQLMRPGLGSLDDVGLLAALGGVRQFPIRIKCALLPWDALRAILTVG